MSKIKLNQRERVLKYIADFGFITSYQAYQDLGITQLGARIKELKDMGYVFETVDIRTKDRYGNPTHYYEYYLTDKVS